MEENAWLAHFLPLAEEGDVDAQIALGWEYAAGRMVKVDLRESERWFRVAAKVIGERAFFYLIKALMINKSERVDTIFKERKEWSLGAIYMIYGNYLYLNGRREDGVELMRIGWRKGNLFSRLYHIRCKYDIIGGILFMPIALYIIIKILYMTVVNKNDDSILR